MNYYYYFCSHVGQSRSAAVVTAYLMKTQHLNLQDYILINSELQNMPKDVFAVDPAQTQNAEAVYSCRKCRRTLFQPVQWMEPDLLGVMDGQLLCPKCSSKLGSFNWYGEQCSCGRWVTPAFQMHKNRVDEIKHISISALK
uniref:protein-tyrosine-phosphatase n=1 Tax=Sinocyclocheilus grahami TaxID=75366 RepID=A0A672NY32_SINGR